MTDEKLIAIDLFSGAGGLSRGFLQTGKVKIAAAVENNEWARKTYEKNHKDQGVEMFGDITKIDFDKLRTSLEAKGHNINIVFGGPPCQGFSNANRQKSELISMNNQLVKTYAMAIEKLNPDAFLMENVKTLKSQKHKFYYSKVDDEEHIDKLNIERKEEVITLGSMVPWGLELVSFINHFNGDISLFLIKEKNFLSKVSHLLRKEKEFEHLLTNSKDPFINYLKKWGELHPEFWSNHSAYIQCWNEIYLQIESYRTDASSISLSELRSNLRSIYETQRILQKVEEIVRKRIHHSDLQIDGDKIIITLQTYSVLDYLKARFLKLGYKFKVDHLNASDYGAPQNRERLFILGVKSSIVGDNEIRLPDPLIIMEHLKYTVEDAISDLEHRPPSTKIDAIADAEGQIRETNVDSNPLLRYLHGGYNRIHNHVMTDSTNVALQRFEALNEGDNFHKLDESYKTTYSNPNRTQNTVYLRLKYKSQSGTVLNVRKSMWIHPTLNRAISIREAARLQTFPDNFIFVGSKDAQYQQIGNAVPPLLGQAVAEQLLMYLGKPVENKLKDIICRETNDLVEV
ncbi:DNA cytosine methyltransferase [Paenibacillus anseongense]|uniref:DNA cytosine methyltransferase n=1 Tax=Paenibacillus anseongense TaxID=2682845 RepID=UPI002DC03A05|nr:DNA cytosine methyltransferase [Paenibacillus anseongense]MEC0269715.1 DNA cytosine methyltransferase [Paenibacillus anseongense]